MRAWRQSSLSAFCLLLATSWGQAHLLAPEQMFIRMDNANQAFMLYLTPPATTLAGFDSDADGVLSTEEISQQREQIDQFLDKNLVFSFDGLELARVFSDITSSAGTDHDHGQITIIRRYVAEQALPGLKIEYGLVPPAGSGDQGIRAIVRPTGNEAGEIFTVGAQGAASSHEIVWDAWNYYRKAIGLVALAAVGLGAGVLWWWRRANTRAKTLEAATNNNASAGFSLIEVMVALVVAAISLSALSLALSRQANQQIIMRESVWGQVVAMNALIEMGAGTGEVFASKGGSENLLGQEWDWKGNAEASSEVSIDIIEVQALLEDSTAATLTGYLFFPERIE